ncbi:hypothetical protein AB6C40_19790, partial [Vibrio splendidus]
MTCLKYREKVLLIFVSKCLKNFFGFHGMDIKDRPYVENIYYRNIASHLRRHKRDWLSSTPGRPHECLVFHHLTKTST